MSVPIFDFGMDFQFPQEAFTLPAEAAFAPPSAVVWAKVSVAPTSKAAEIAKILFNIFNSSVGK
jgi:hypothetical protein